MPIKLLLLPLLLVGSLAAANEMFLTPPTEIVLSGADRYGESAYEIRAILDRTGEKTRLRELSVRIYDDSISVVPELLEKVLDPDFGNIKVINDAGILGSYFYIYIPFGEPPRCRAARKEKLRTVLNISSDAGVNGDGLEARIYDPCD